MLRAAWRLLRVLLHILHGLAIVWTRSGMRDDASRWQRMQWWSAKLLRILGIGLVARGQPRPGGVLIVANHVSWLDIVAIHAMCPQARFVSKAEVRRWPLLNSLVSASGTMYLDRGCRRDALHVVHRMAEALRSGATMAVFPEGTTGDGNALLPFHANLLQAAISSEAAVQPVALRFSDERHPVSPSVAYVGSTSLLQSLWKVVCAQGLTVNMDWLPLQPSANTQRRALAEHLRQRIAQALHHA